MSTLNNSQIKLTRITAEGMRGHVDYKISTGIIVIDPTQVSVVSEFSTTRYSASRKPVLVTQIQVGEHQYCVTETLDEVLNLINK